MANIRKRFISSFFTILVITSALCFPSIIAKSSKPTDPTPTPWPLQFYSMLFVNNSGTLQKADLWYDWPNGRCLHIFQFQLGKLLYDVEWNNGTSFYYTLDSSNRECRNERFPVGIIRPNWLDGANYIGQSYKDGFLCNGWEKINFVWYYEDVVTKRPVYWIFYNGVTIHVMTLEVGKVLEDSKWQAPMYCFGEGKAEEPLLQPVASANPHGSFMRGLLVGASMAF